VSPSGAGSRQERKRAAKDASPEKARIGFGYIGLAAISLIGVVCFGAFVRNVTWHTIENYGYGRQLNDDKLELVVVNEGPLTTTWIFESEETIQVGAGHVSLAVTYITGASTQAVQGHFPVLFYPGKDSPKNCLGICLGSGQSFGALLMYPIESLDVVDISREMIDISLNYYREYNHELGTDSRVRIHQDDGRHFVDRAEEASYDVVSMEPPPPTADGVSSLYSIEFYESVKRTLRPGGVFMQWLPLYRITPLDCRGIIGTQAEVFPETFVVKVGQDDFMVLSYPQRPTFHVSAIDERCKTFRQERKIAGRPWWRGCTAEMASRRGVMSALLSGPTDVARLEAPMFYHDDNQILSYSSGDRHLLRIYRGPPLSWISFPEIKLTRFRDLAGYFEPPLSDEDVRALDTERSAALAYFKVPDPVAMDASIAKLETDPTASAKVTRALRLADRFGSAFYKDRMFAWIDRAIEYDPKHSLKSSLERVRKITRDGIAPFADKTEAAIDRLAEKHGNVPIVAAMRAELKAYRTREKAKNDRYLFE
jgi:spermidine synthase